MKTVGTLIFKGFELLDTFGPLQMFGLAWDQFELRLVSEEGGAVKSSQGPVSLCNDSFADNHPYDILLVPGGRGTRREVDNAKLIGWLREKAEAAEIVSTVCTGSALLAKTGLLDGRRATTNKAAFAWVESQGPSVEWQKQARWVEDDKFFTSSGVSAGMDMNLAVIAHVCGEETARQISVWAEYEWHDDPSWDPFAEIHGLV